MNEFTLQRKDTSAQSANLVALDRVLNDRICQADTDAQAGYWWAWKVHSKRRLAAVSETEVDAVAAEILRELRGAAA